MPIIVKNNPIQILMEVFDELYPDVEIEVCFMSGMREYETGDGEKGVWGITYPDSKPIAIDIAGELPVEHLPEILAHELAHAVTYKEGLEDHGPEWDAVFDELCDRFNTKLKPIQEVILKERSQ